MLFKQHIILTFAIQISVNHLICCVFTPNDPTSTTHNSVAYGL